MKKTYRLRILSDEQKSELREKFPFIVRFLDTPGRVNRANGTIAVNLIVRCPCCQKEREIEDCALTLHCRACKSPSGWCRGCGVSLGQHPREWIKILPQLHRKHGSWAYWIMERFAVTKKRAVQRKVKFNISVLDLPILPSHCPVFPWIKFEAPKPRWLGKAKNITYSQPRGYLNLAPSLDRMNSLGGYTKKNIRWVSCRANALKSNISCREAKFLFRDIRKLVRKGSVE
jgi:hypothetical protein